jgi:hypothetical protein
MLRKMFIGALVAALTPALALAAPATMTMKHQTTKPAVTHVLKHKQKKVVRKAKSEKIRLIMKHRAVNKMKTVAHPTHRNPTHKI